MHSYKSLFGRLAAIVLALSLLGGCAQAVGGISHGIQTDAEFNELILEDVRQAKAMARATHDMLAAKCWSYVENFTVVNAPGDEMLAGEGAGVLSTYQKARNMRRSMTWEISDEFRLECGPMLTDSMGVLGRLGIRLVL